MRTRNFLLLVIFALPLSGQADPIFGKDMAGDRELPRAFGIGIDYFNMDQPYQIDNLSVDCQDQMDLFCQGVRAGLLPVLSDTSSILVDNEIEHVDLKFDVWLLPFLNVFAIYGNIDGQTTVDLRNTGVPLPPDLNVLHISYDGDVYGGGVVLAAGGDKWFASLTGTFTDTDLNGSFDSSSVQALAIQPRFGIRATESTEVWIGGYFIDAEEKHSGGIVLDVVGVQIPLNFAVDLSQDEDFNLSIGIHSMFSEHFEATVEIGGGGDRDTVLGNLTYRF